MELPYCGFWINHSTTCNRVSTSVSSLSTYPFMFGATYPFMFGAIIFIFRNFNYNFSLQGLSRI